MFSGGLYGGMNAPVPLQPGQILAFDIDVTDARGITHELSVPLFDNPGLRRISAILPEGGTRKPSEAVMQHARQKAIEYVHAHWRELEALAKASGGRPVGADRVNVSAGRSDCRTKRA